jgi:hypothetical protein
MKFIFTLDTEADNAWARTPSLSLENLKCIPKFQSLCERFGIIPTYLCTYEVVRSSGFPGPLERSIADGKCEIGAHLHPWSTPPFEPVTENDFLYHPYPHELPRNLFWAKMEVLTKAIQHAIGEHPASYRAGRWGLGGDDVPILVDLGYTVDCSVTPFVSWKNMLGDPAGQGGPDYRRARPSPFHLRHNAAPSRENAVLLEVPMTILFTRKPFTDLRLFHKAFCTTEHPFLVKLLSKIGRGPLWFRPFPYMSTATLILVYKTAKTLRLPYIQMMLHSSELLPGGSPYYQDEPSIDRLYETLHGVFDYLMRDGCQPVSLKQYATNHIPSHPQLFANPL